MASNASAWIVLRSAEVSTRPPRVQASRAVQVTLPSAVVVATEVEKVGALAAEVPAVVHS